MTALPASEWVRIIDIRHLPAAVHRVSANADERRRLAARFGLSAIDRLEATVTLIAQDARVSVAGRISADIVQACAISGEDFAVVIDEPVALRFVPAAQGVDPEIAISADDCDDIAYDGLTFDLGEALAQTLALAIDPFAEGPQADRARAEHRLAGDPGSGAFGALSALRIPS